MQEQQQPEDIAMMHLRFALALVGMNVFGCVFSCMLVIMQTQSRGVSPETVLLNQSLVKKEVAVYALLAVSKRCTIFAQMVDKKKGTTIGHVVQQCLEAEFRV